VYRNYDDDEGHVVWYYVYGDCDAGLREPTSSDGQGFQKPHGYAGTGTVGKGQGTDSKTLCKTRTLVKGQGLPVVYAAGFSFRTNSFTNEHPLVAKMLIYQLIQRIPLNRIFVTS
jgi:hypothetical protein